MQDHCYASLNAANNVFPDSQVLMCYFHVKLNIRKNLLSVLKESDVPHLHYSTTKQIYIERLATFRKKYSHNTDAMDYMNKEWFDSPFNN
jgi:hypothetical protein